MRLGTIYRYFLLSKLNILNNFREHNSILDIGGFDGFTLNKLNGKTKTLVDPDLVDKFPNILYRCESFFDSDLKKNYYDLVTSLDVLEHIKKDEEADYFSKINSVLSKGGRAIITTPSKNIRVFPNFLRAWIGKKWGHYKCLGYTKNELEILLSRAKVKDYSIFSYHSRKYLNYYLFLKFIEPFLPKRKMLKILHNLAIKDAKLDLSESKGFYLIIIEK